MQNALKRLEGVQDVDVSLEYQNALIILKPGEILNPMILREAVEKANFSPRDIHIKATGEIVVIPVKDTAQVADLAFKMPDTGQIFLPVSPPPKKADKEKEQAEKIDLLPKLREAFKAGKKNFIISGRVKTNKENSLSLLVEEFEVTQKK